MDEFKQWYHKQLGQKTSKALAAHGFDAYYCKTREEARKKTVSLASRAKSVGVGGSMTVRQVGILETLRSKGRTIFDHWLAKPEDVMNVRRAQLGSDMFLTSANGITESGEIVNIDGMGNRISAMTFGPKKVVILAGVNKIVPDVHAAINRIKNVAAPINAKRLGMKTPCATRGKCVDCNSPQRICNIIHIMERKPAATDISVIIIGEELGY